MVKFCDLTSTKINPNKSATACIYISNFTPFSVNNSPIPHLGDSGYYKYLGLWINFKLDWSKQHQISETEFEKCLVRISSKRYIPVHFVVKLINAVAFSPIMYRMNNIMFNYNWLIRIYTKATSTLCSITKTLSNCNGFFWFLLRGLKHPHELNIKQFVNCNYKRITYFEDNIAFKSTVQDLGYGIIENNHRQANVIEWNSYIGVPSPMQVLYPMSLQLVDNKFIHPSLKNIEKYRAPIIDLSSVGDSVIIATDGSLKWCQQEDEKICYTRSGFISHLSHSINFSPKGSATNFEAELQAIESAIGSSLNIESVSIFSDSKSAISTILNNHSWKAKVWRKCLSKPTIVRINNYLQMRKINNLPPVKLFHVPSHTFDSEFISTNKSKAVIKFMNEHFNHRLVLNLNYQIDRIVNLNNNDRHSPGNRFDDGNDPTSIVNLNQIPIANRFKETLSTIFKEYYTLKSHRANKHYLNKAIDWTGSTWPITNKFKYEEYDLSLFQFQRISKTLKTRYVMDQICKKGTSKIISATIKSSIKRRFDNPFCAFCLASNIEIEHSYDHIFSDCPNSKRINNELALHVYKILEKVYIGISTRVHMWFNHSMERLIPDGPNPFITERFTLKDGDRRFIPSSLKTTYQNLYYFSDRQIEDIYNKIVEIVPLFLKKIQRNTTH